MATHTGLTSAVLNYKPPDPLMPEFEVQLDRAIFADPKKTSLLSGASKIDNLTPWIGTELHGLQLNQLTNAQRDELALLVAERGAVFVRDQDWTLDQQYELTKYWDVPDRDPIQLDPRHVTIIGRDNDRGYANFGNVYLMSLSRYIVRGPFHCDLKALDRLQEVFLGNRDLMRLKHSQLRKLVC